MELQNSTKTSLPKKIKLDFKDSKYATGRRKRSIAKVWIKKVQVLFTLMEKKCMNISNDQYIKLLYYDH